MRIGIFGDSYGADTDWYGRQYGNCPWSKTLGSLDSRYHIENKARIGSSLWWSYQQLIHNNVNYDRTIFFVTSPKRMYFRNIDDTILKHHVNFVSIERALADNSISNNTRRILSAAREWHIHAVDDEWEELSFQLLINHIVAKYPNFLFVKCFHHFKYEVPGYYGNSMYEITQLDENFYKNNSNWTDEMMSVPGADRRSNHMNDANNAIFANCIHEWIQNGNFDMNLTKFVAPDKPLEYYFALPK
jgi:hypothetical protein